MAEETFTRFQQHDGVARLTLNRPQKRNALTRGFLAELHGHLQRLQDDDSVRLLTLEAAGPVFCAGMDLAEMQQRAGRASAAQEWEADTHIYRNVVEELFRLPFPTLAVLPGPVLAGGTGLMLACDMVLAAETAWIALPEPKRGITAAVVTPLLLYRVGAGIAGSLLLSGKRMTAEEALRHGLFHEVVSASSLARQREEWVASILTGAPSALRLTKRTLQECAAGLLSVQWDVAENVSARARETDEAREGLAAFLEKRPPGWFPQSPRQSDGHSR